MRPHHVGIRTPNLKESIRQFQALGYRCLNDEPCYDAHDDVLLVLMQHGKKGQIIELIEPGPNSQQEARPNIHHLCLEAEDFAKAKEDLAAAGLLRFADDRAAPLFDGKKICWFYGKHVGVIELKEK